MLNAAFRGALDQLDANVMVADNDLKIIFVNPAGRADAGAGAGRAAQGTAGLRRRQAAGREPRDPDDASPAVLRGVIERLTDIDHAPGSDRRPHDEDHHESDEGRHRSSPRHGASSGSTARRKWPPSPNCRTSSRPSRPATWTTASRCDGKRDFFLHAVERHQRAGRRHRHGGRRSAGPGGRGQPGRPDEAHRDRRARPGLLVKIGAGINELTDEHGGPGLAGEAGGRRSQPRRGRDQPGQCQPLAAHRGAGLVAGRDRLLDGRDDQHGQAERRQRRPGQPAGAWPRATRPRRAARWCPRPCGRWPRSTSRRRRSPTSSA